MFFNILARYLIPPKFFYFFAVSLIPFITSRSLYYFVSRIIYHIDLFYHVSQPFRERLKII